MLSEEDSKEEKLQPLDDQEREFLYLLCKSSDPFRKQLGEIAKAMFISKTRLGMIQTAVYKKLEIKTEDPYKKRETLKKEYCEKISRFNKFEDFKDWKREKPEAPKVEPPKPPPAVEKPPPAQPTQPSLVQPVYEKQPVEIPPSVKPFIKETTQPRSSQPVEINNPPPPPITTRPRTIAVPRPRRESIRPPWAFISALILIAIVIFFGRRLLVVSGIFVPRTTPAQTTRLTSTVKPSPTITITTRPTRTPTVTPTPVPLPFIDNLTDEIRSEWRIFGDTPYIENGMLKTGHYIDDSNFRGITGLYIGNQTWGDLIIETNMSFDCVNQGRQVGIGVRVQGIEKSMIWASFKGCGGNLYTAILSNESIIIPANPTFTEPLSSGYDFIKWDYYTDILGNEYPTMPLRPVDTYAIIRLIGNHMSLYFDRGTGIEVDLPQGYESGGVFFLMDESVGIYNVNITSP